MMAGHLDLRPKYFSIILYTLSAISLKNIVARQKHEQATYGNLAPGEFSFPEKCRGGDSNPGKPDYESGALDPSATPALFFPC